MVDQQQNSPPATAVVVPSSGVPLAVIGFGFAIITLSLFNVGALDAGAFSFFPIMAMGTGALAMLIGGIWEARSANVFGATFGVAYACFLLTTGALLQFFAPGIREAAGEVVFNQAFGAYLLIWTVFTAVMTIGSFYVNLPALLAFALLTIVYLFAGLSNLVTGDASVILTRIAGWAGLLDGVAAWYLGLGILLNVMSGRTLMPMRPYIPHAVSK